MNNTNNSRDTGMAIVLLVLLAFYLTECSILIPVAITIQILVMAKPSLFSYVSPIWFGISHLMGTFISKILLSLIFVILVTPTAIVRKIVGYDPMQRVKWKCSEDSVFHVRSHKYTSKDLTKPY